MPFKPRNRPLIRSKKPALNLNFKSIVEGINAKEFSVFQDPVEWIESNFPLKLYSNQIVDIRTIFDKKIRSKGFATIACRGGGKTSGVTLGLICFASNYPGLKVIICGPINRQASRLLKEAFTYLKDPRCKAGKLIDWDRTTTTNLVFLNGSQFIAFSGQEKANIEGEHGHILVVDEAHKVPSYSYTNKMLPMLGSKEFNFTIFIGVASHNNFFRKFCNTPGAIVNRCPWDKAEIFQDKEDVVFYKGKPYSQTLINRMPLPYKIKYFKDRPDLQKLSAMEMPTQDWETQYELIWLDNIRNFLSKKDAEWLAQGTQGLILKQNRDEEYYAGLDTAQGSLMGHGDTDETVLSIWRVKRGKQGRIKERVACWVWQGDPLSQKEEIFNILNQEDGLFSSVKFILVDYSNIGIDVVNIFQEMRIPILGKLFGSTENKSKKNYKNAMFDHFLVELQSLRLKYPNIKDLEALQIEETNPDKLVQIKNMLEGFGEWIILERIKGKGLNDKIQAPTEKVENDQGKEEKAKDDHCSADVLAVWAADHLAEMLDEYGKIGSSYRIPAPTIGRSSLSNRLGVAMGTGGSALTGFDRVRQEQEARRPKVSKGKTNNEDSWLQSVLAPRGNRNR